jgi:hypothetical protein
VNPVIVVVGLLALVIVAVPGFPVIADHVPVPVPVMVAVPPGSMAQLTTSSVPALGLVMMTVSATDAEQVPSV